MLRVCNNLLGSVLDVEFRSLQMILPLARIGGVRQGLEGLIVSLSSVIEADKNESIGLLFLEIGVICLKHGATTSTRIACRD